VEDDLDQHQVNVTHLWDGGLFCELFDFGGELYGGTSLVTIGRH